MNRRRFAQLSLAAAIGAQLPLRGAYSAILGPSARVDADIDAVTGDGKSVTLAKAAVQELGESLRGNLLLPGHPAYEEARRVQNASISKFPALIVQPTGAADVRTAVDFARSSSLLVAVKCGGGFGRVARRFGLALDNVRAVDIVTADGQLRHASADENADLYWGVRGGGGNFGIVTSFEFELHPMDRQVIGGNMTFPLSQARQLLDFYSDYHMEAPDELSLDAGLYSVRGVQGEFFIFGVCYSGPKNRAERILDTIRKAGKPVDDTVGPVDYVALQRSGDETDPRAVGSYTKSGFSAGLSPAFIDAILTGFEARPDRGTIFAFQQGGGAINRIKPDATAFPHRDITLTPLLIVDWAIEKNPKADVDWLHRYWATIEPHIKGFYTNNLIDETQKQVDENYLGNYPRLVALKDKYDPTNLFRLNANVRPTA